MNLQQVVDYWREKYQLALTLRASERTTAVFRRAYARALCSLLVSLSCASRNSERIDMDKPFNLYANMNGQNLLALVTNRLGTLLLWIQSNSGGVAGEQSQEERSKQLAYVSLANALAVFYRGIIKLFGYDFDPAEIELTAPTGCAVVTEEITVKVRRLLAVADQMEERLKLYTGGIDAAEAGELAALSQDSSRDDQVFACLLAAVNSFLVGTGDGLEVAHGQFPAEFTAVEPEILVPRRSLFRGQRRD